MLKYKWLLCLVSVMLFSAGWYHITGFTLMFALVPLLLISHSYDSSRRSFWKMVGWCSLTFGLWNIVCNWWVWYAAPIGTIASTVAQILLFGGVFMIYHYISKRAKHYLAYIVLVCGWIAAEHLYLHGEISFPWILLGNGFANETWAVQWYSLTGIFGGSLWVLLSNLLIYKFIITRDKRYLATEGALVVVPLICSLIMFWSLRDFEGPQAKITLVQPNIDPYEEKFSVSQYEQNRIMLELAAEAPSDVDIILMPETAIEDNIWEHKMFSSPTIKLFHTFVSENYPQAQLITGATTYGLYGDENLKTETARLSRHGYWYDVYNTALAIDSTQTIGVHHKNKLVVGAEKMPYMKVLKLMERFIVDLGGTTGQLGRDDIIRVFRLDRPGREAVYSSAPVCYESVYGEHFGKFAANGANVMLIITNDGWWHDTPGYKQHFSFARLRAIETRRYIARSANTGISGFINPRGDVGQTLGWDKRGTLTDSVTLESKVTFYAKYGDYIGRISSYIFVLGLLYYIAYRFRRKSHIQN